MLARLLELISQTNIQSTTLLAQKLNVSKELVESMIADLVRKGYLLPLTTCGLEECGGCRVSADCSQRGKCWVVR